MGKTLCHYDKIANFNNSEIAVKTFSELVSRGSRVGLKLTPGTRPSAGVLYWTGSKLSFMRYYTIDLMKGWIGPKEWAGLMHDFIKA